MNNLQAARFLLFFEHEIGKSWWFTLIISMPMFIKAFQPQINVGCGL